jgi:hypothetical protein
MPPIRSQYGMNISQSDQSLVIFKIYEGQHAMTGPCGLTNQKVLRNKFFVHRNLKIENMVLNIAIWLPIYLIKR